MAGRAFVGTSGFAYPEWKGSFYPPGLPGTRLLAFYAERLPSVEINYTFRREPTPKVIDAWRSATPDGFRFAIKASMRITHLWPLDPPDDVLTGFLDAVRPLGERLGPMLFQTGPRFALDTDRLNRFLDRLPEGIAPAFEFRHPSWEEARTILEERGGAWCASETEASPIEELPSGPIVYLRLRRPDYDEASLEAWARRLRPVLRQGRDAYVFFKHEGGDEGPAWAGRLGAALAG